MAHYMALLQTLNSMVNQQLSAAAVNEILAIVGRIITEYEEQAFCFKQEIDSQRKQLDADLHRAELHGAGW